MSLTVEQLKQRLFSDKLTVLPVGAQKLISCSKVLQNDDKVSALGSKKMMLLRDHTYIPGEVNLRVRMPNLKSPPLDTFASPHTTVKRLKQMLEDCHAFPSANLYSLFIDGVALADDQQLKCYCLKSANLSKQNGRIEIQVVPAMNIQVRTKVHLIKAKVQSTSHVPNPVDVPGATMQTRGASAEVNPLAEVNTVGGVPITDVEVISSGNSKLAPTPTSAAAAAAIATAEAAAAFPTSVAAASASTVPQNIRTGFMPRGGATAGHHGYSMDQMDQIQIRTEMEVDWPAPAVLQPALDRTRSAEAAIKLVREEMSSGAEWTAELNKMVQVCMMTQGQAHMRMPAELVCQWVECLLKERKTALKDRKEQKMTKLQNGGKDGKIGKKPAMSKGFLSGLYDDPEKKAERRRARNEQKRKDKAALAAVDAFKIAAAAAAAAAAAVKIAKKASKKKKPKKFKSLMSGLLSSKSTQASKVEKPKAGPKIEFSKLERV